LCLREICLVFLYRCCWAVSNHDFIEAYNCQAIVVQYPLVCYPNTECQLSGNLSENYVIVDFCDQQHGYSYCVIFRISVNE